MADDKIPRTVFNLRLNVSTVKRERTRDLLEDGLACGLSDLGWTEDDNSKISLTHSLPRRV